MDITITTLAERPELADRIYEVRGALPAFLTHDKMDAALFAQLQDTHPQYAFVATSDDGAVVARGHSVPFALHAADRGALPPDGWDRILVWAARDVRTGTPPDTVSALLIMVDQGVQQRGLSRLMLEAMRDNARERGHAELVAPVRPNEKHLRPRRRMAEYVATTRDDGLPVDGWLRTHVRLGGVIDSVATTSMMITGTLDQWREWTGLPFDADGPVEVPGALVPVWCDTTHGHASYVEPNVWVRHALA